MKVQVINKENETTIYDTPTECAKALDLRRQNVSKCINSTNKYGELKRGTYRYWKFSYVTE